MRRLSVALVSLLLVAGCVPGNEAPQQLPPPLPIPQPGVGAPIENPIQAAPETRVDTAAMVCTIDPLSCPPQLGLNEIRFYWSGDGTTPHPRYRPAAIFADFQALGIFAARHLTRADLVWAEVEPRDNEWHFQGADAVLATRFAEPIVTLFADHNASPTPPWVTDPVEFRRTLGPEAEDYLRTVVTHYAAAVKYWELGNELDRGSWPAAGGYPPREQGKFLAAAAAIVRECDPDAVILLPGLSHPGGAATDWLSEVIAGGGSDWFDIVTYHYYGPHDRFLPLRDRFAVTLKLLGLGDKPVWLTETGVTADLNKIDRTNYPNSERSQAADVFRRTVQAWGTGDVYVGWSSYISGDGPDDEWRGYGIRTEAGEPRLAWATLKLLATELYPFAKIETLAATTTGVNQYRFTSAMGETKYVIWGVGSITIPAGVSRLIQVVPPAGTYSSWQTVTPGQAISLAAEPLLLK